MKYSIVASCLLMSVCAQAVRERTTPPQVRVMTYNVRSSAGDRKSKDNNWKARRDDFARVGAELFAIADGELLALLGSTAVTGSTREETVAWEAVTGLQSFRLPENKRVSRYNIRLSMAAGASLSVAVQYDSDGVWRSAGSVTASGAGTGHFLFPVRPHRCDHLQLKLSGQGEMKLLSISRVLEIGSDYR